MPIEPVRVAPEGPAGPIPTLVFVPDDPPARMPLVLLGHGGHLSKDDATMQLLCRGAVVGTRRGRDHGRSRSRRTTST